MALINYVVGSAEVSDLRKDIPAGQYVMMWLDSEMKDTKDRTGQYLQLKGQVIEGEHKGHVMFERLNLWNKNEQAVKIAQGTLESICRAVGIEGVVADSAQLHDKLFTAKVTYKTQERQKGVMVELDEGRRNSIAGYLPYTGAATFTPPSATVVSVHTPAAAAVPPTATAGAAEAAPWDK